LKQPQALLRPSFKKVNTEDTRFFEIHFQELLQALPAVNPFSGLIDVDLQPLFTRMTLDSATELLLGESFHSQLTHSAPETKAFVESFDFATRNVYLYDALRNGFLMPLGLFYWAMRRGGKDKFTKSCEAVHKAIDDRITRQLQQGFGAAAEAKRYVFLEGLAQETSDKKQIRDEILSVLFAGRDSTGSSLANVMFMMARKPEAWKQVREEVMNVTQGNLPDAAMLRQMKFLRNVLNESTYMLLLVPITPLSSHLWHVRTIQQAPPVTNPPFPQPSECSHPSQ
jgi:cytochrome P450